jgi:hypothetical protein
MMARDPLAAVRDAATIRTRCAAVTRAVADGLSGWFTIDRAQLPVVAREVAALTRERFPDLKIPYHSRWRHFEAGGVDRKGELDALLAGRSAAEVARARIDLTVVSVLLDAGAGARWRYTETRGVDALALPVHRQKGEDLLAMLNAAGGKAAEAPVAKGEAMPEPADTATTPSATPSTGRTSPVFTRSEGLGVASFRAFVAGVFSADPKDPLRVDAMALKRLDAAALASAFQVSAANPLVGVEGRAALLVRLGEVLQAMAAQRGGEARPGRLFDDLIAAGGGERPQGWAAPNPPPEGVEKTWDGPAFSRDPNAASATGHPVDGASLATTPGTPGSSGRMIPAAAVLRELVTAYAPIWVSGSHVLGLPAGDVWPHLWAGDESGPSGARPDLAGGPTRDPATAGWVPFHKLSQWLTYSLLEPLQWAGIEVTDLDALTGLPEYRNGGLLLDHGVIVPRSRADLGRTWKPSDPFVVEWRALTVTLLDELATLVRAELGVDAEAMPLACVLEGGTWAAGRRIARQLRDGAPPFRIDSDGTVF